MSGNDVLQVSDLHAYYGKSHILRGLNMRVGTGEIVSVLGRNGVGRSTAIKAIMGQVRATGSARFRGKELVGRQSHAIANLGVGYVPENRDVFPNLTVMQNLILGEKARRKSSRWTIEDVFTLFPRLRERANTPGGVLSGGEQQLLTMCRTLLGDPDLIMVDEPTEGLAPMMVNVIRDLLQEIARRGISIVLVEQKLTIALEISQRCYVMGSGQAVFEGTPADLRADSAVRREWLEV